MRIIVAPAPKRRGGREPDRICMTNVALANLPTVSVTGVGTSSQKRLPLSNGYASSRPGNLSNKGSRTRPLPSTKNHTSGRPSDIFLLWRNMPAGNIPHLDVRNNLVWVRSFQVS